MVTIVKSHVKAPGVSGELINRGADIRRGGRGVAWGAWGAYKQTTKNVSEPRYTTYLINELKLTHHYIWSC